MVNVGFEQNFTVGEDEERFDVCISVFNPVDGEELPYSVNLVVDTIPGTAGMALHNITGPRHMHTVCH